MRKVLPEHFFRKVLPEKCKVLIEITVVSLQVWRGMSAAAKSANVAKRPGLVWFPASEGLRVLRSAALPYPARLGTTPP
jgi:hypothetical protein